MDIREEDLLEEIEIVLDDIIYHGGDLMSPAVFDSMYRDALCL